ncbi:ScpA family protein [Methyloversatilis sp.]|uniref:segregation and condensation protein A n=1 Tax=Methyloversatilis sp. TaxID=2569862 RepID=UPI002735D5C8|nr:segregation/condensation protein A [Methyloversatilis sp.]MDP2868978.1 segregation/condensation protein A [Methyloversatilis sp.]MDP3455205.1 segregation/condensation protein A [Methyloversatilis sp.]MDP3579546.1 segregation/condensation protein A [Methyloversatilis sp.]
MSSNALLVEVAVPTPVRLYGETLEKLPLDLYIPPDALEVFLDAFQGPLDLLLYLIRKANVDILDIPMAPLTAQYLVYVEAMRTHRLELAAEYLLMAAMLLEIKSRMLLPRPPRESADDGEDPRAELVRRLIEYEQMKAASLTLDAIPRAQREHEWVGVQVAERIAEIQPAVSAADLQLAWLALMRHADVTRHHKVSREALSVREFMSGILRRLTDEGSLRFDQLFEAGAPAAQMVVNFLAVLELARENLIELLQIEAFAPIYVRHATPAVAEPV